MLNSTGEVSTRIEVVNSVRHTMPAIYQVTYTCHSHAAFDFPHCFISMVLLGLS